MSTRNRGHLRGVPPPDERPAAKAAPESQLLLQSEFLAPPRDLKGEELEIWIELREEYTGRLSEADRTLFGKLVANESRYREAHRKVREVGALIKSPSGYPIQNPYLAIANKAEAQALRVSVQLGLTPLSRGRVKAHKNKQLRTNPFADLKSLDN